MQCDCGAREVKGLTLHRPECASRALKLERRVVDNEVERLVRTVFKGAETGNPTGILKNPAAVSLGRQGGKARAARMTPEQRSERARVAARARWRGEAS